MSYQNIIAEARGAVGWIQLNRPEALNALSNALVSEVGQAIEQFQADDNIGAMVITGNAKAFAAGADIKDMEGQEFIDLFLADFPYNRRDGWDSLNTARKPIIAAVAGFALGGGCEMAMACDFILAADTAKFGQPEINIGTMPGAGGTQRLTKAIGKAKAMEMCLTGRMMDAEEAERAGLVSRIIPADQLEEEALKVAGKIAKLSRPTVYMIKEAVNVAFETSLQEGLRFERRAFASTFATADQKEGMKAFVEKRKPEFKNR
ncbi:enoyl-CoA hydratase [Oceanospirillum multiglobuliferum]|uniref:enoyl-CoA hydratase n=1 Tax=Oceanospirillum multiglobuliferum TaxID=64969 RepID=A0A1T4PCG5_9GAMM|nr:enoyl-CoA hydratase [Oceanospirillum multiglobuliferum]OPX55603.1 enoyl-CoA hydratase [Oceanospirillum multiglobuliferum]SJZ89214.1 enoyl-CoA hydratase [Oceanospirillum multiglobuliferum]